MHGFYAIVDAGALDRRNLDPLAFAEAVLSVSPAALQLRAKNVSARETLALLRALAPMCHRAGVKLVANDRPDLAILAGDPAARSLVCSRCSTAWLYRRVGCPFCHDVERQAYYVDGDARYRLYLCQGCRRYLKTIDARRLGGNLDPKVERLVTIGMDLAALREGYGPA